MTEAEKLLQETKSAVVAETQTEDICVIDSDLRIIDIPEQFKVLGVENDKDVKVMQFRMPKVYKGTDLSAFNISVNYQNARGTKDRYVVADKKVSGDQIEFSWTVGKTATVYRGDTRFIVCMRLIGSDGVIKKEFNTTLATMTVLEGLEVDNPVIEQEEKDIIAQLLQIVDDKSKEAVQAVTAEGTKQIKAVQAEAQEIAADREQIKTNKADIADLRQTKAGAIINSAKGERIAVGDSTGAFFEGLKLYGKTEQVQTKGYQLFDASEVKPASMGGATVTANSDGSYTVSGTGRLTKDFWIGGGYSHDEVLKLFKAGKLTVSAKATMPKVYVSLSGSKGKHFEIYAGETVNITKEMLEDTNLSAGFGIYGSTSKEIIPGTVKPMIYQDGDGTWEPYTGGKPSPSMEYKQDPESSGDSGVINVNVGEENTQHLSIQTPNGLPGIKVDSGGNYTDSNGQQWVCDEMDFKRGKYVQRIKKVVFNGGKDEVWRREFSYVYILINDSAPLTIPIVNKFVGVKNSNSNANTNNCSTISSSSALTCCLTGITDGELQVWTTHLQTNPIEVLYILATPIETDIPEETMNVYRRLYTNFPSTVIQNDSGAGMEVEYVADTKQFILDQIKALVQA